MASKQQSVAKTFNSLQIEKQSLRRAGLVSHLGTLKTLLRPGIVIRGRSGVESNIYQFNLDKAKNDHGLKLLMKEERYTTSHGILDERRNMFVSAARRELLAGSLEKNFYSILADESSDIAKKELLSFSVRTCSNDYEVFEDLLGVFDCMDGVSSDSLLHYIKDSIKKNF